ncbi:helix-turn-helix domain-containing protein [Conexibacter arvalis]|uniref:helix-turn-helix domain-containing protein n=1 Tax=Conexibacter arvalis TaxID=912552 RepID=UPI00160AA4C7
MPEDPRIIIGRNLRAARDRAGLSQGKVSQQSGVDQAQVNRIENGKTHVRTDTLIRLARALRTTPSELLRGIE